MAQALPTILKPNVVVDRISRLRVINDQFQRALGMQSGGPNEGTSPIRHSSYDVFNDTRDLPPARKPGTPAARIARQPVGNVPYTIPRSAHAVPLLLEELHNLRRIGGPADTNEGAMLSYITEQERILKQRNTNLREFQIAAMFRGSYTFTQSGDDLIHDFSGGQITVNFQVPAGNLNQLDMLGTGDIIGTAWDNAAAPIIDDLFAIDAAFSELVGRGLSDVWVTSTVWGFISANTQVQNQAGSSNRFFEVITQDQDTVSFTARLHAAPWITFHITNNGLNVGTANTFTKLIEDTAAIFHVPMTSEIADYMLCPEPVIEEEGTPEVIRIGEHYWPRRIPDPAMIELHALHNGLPRLRIPAAVAYGTVDF